MRLNAEHDEVQNESARSGENVCEKQQMGFSAGHFVESSHAMSNEAPVHGSPASRHSKS